MQYDSLSLVQFQIGLKAPKRQFCVGLFQTVCKQWAKGPGKIPKLQKDAGFKKGLFTCFSGHTPVVKWVAQKGWIGLAG